jgi:hypothetical protein
VHLYAEDWQDFGESHGNSPLCPEQVWQLVGFWFYVSCWEVEGLPGLPAAIMCSHCYVAFPRFEVAEDDENEGALRYAAHMSSGRDLVEEFIGYRVWLLAHG